MNYGLTPADNPLMNIHTPMQVRRKASSGDARHLDAPYTLSDSLVDITDRHGAH